MTDEEDTIDRPRSMTLAAIAATLGAAILLVALAGAGGAGTTSAENGAPRHEASQGSTATPAAVATPMWQRASYRRIGFDKSFKADLIDQLPAPPELVVFGGSRATRFEPSFLASQTGLATFNCAVQCFRPEDAWAFSSYLYSRAPDVRLRCIIALQTRTFHDDTMRGGLLYDERLARAFPPSLVERQKTRLGTPPVKQLLGVNRFLGRGFLKRNRYDVTRERPDYSFDRHIDQYIRRLLPNHRWDGPLRAGRSRLYFEKTVQLYNDHAVVPLIVIMPYQPRALRAFRAAGFQKHLDRLTAYLREAQTRCEFRVLDLTDIESFGGRARWFYDGAHVTRENCRLIERYAVSAAPECFR